MTSNLIARNIKCCNCYKVNKKYFFSNLIPLFAFLYNRGELKGQNYSILSIFPYFVIGFIGMIIVRNIGDQFFTLIVIIMVFGLT